jgi:hypothetical protein
VFVEQQYRNKIIDDYLSIEKIEGFRLVMDTTVL